MQNKKEYVSLRSSCTVKRIPFQSCILFSFASTPSSIFPDDFCLFPKKCISFRNNSHILCNVTDCLSVRYPVKKTTYFLLNAAFPGYCAPVPSSSSIRSAIPSIMAAVPNTLPDRMLSIVFVPITCFGTVRSIWGS